MVRPELRLVGGADEPIIIAQITRKPRLLTLTVDFKECRRLTPGVSGVTKDTQQQFIAALLPANIEWNPVVSAAKAKSLRFDN